MSEELEARWDKAIEHARYMLKEYLNIPTGVFGATYISIVIQRYESGERTEELLKELEEIK
ncbi:hypothetical protein [Paenibacillus lutrae]|uniref:Uncharacterized protein n=1 Tax=Paenibacillus lutrae TaxID=2078573 RepID=A0A7X3FJB5_9BACL|nr:hypothetical protein [Paenibacillus lutrae]MVP00362.1 hypothetical protein [Paenibacillus lutrae]